MSKSETNLSVPYMNSNPMLPAITEEFRPEMDTEMNLLGYWAILRKHLFLVIICSAVGLIISIFYTTRLPNMYQSGASVAVITPKKNSQGLPIEQTSYYTTHLSTQVAILRSRSMAKKVLERIPEAICLSFFGKNRKEVAAGQLLATISVLTGDKSDILYIRCAGKNPENVAYIANLYIDVFIKENEQQIQNTKDGVLDWLKKEVPILQKKIREKRDILVKLQQENPEIRTYTQEQGGRALSRVDSVKNALQNLNMSMIDVEFMYQKCLKVKKSKSLNTILTFDLFMKNEIINDLQKKKFTYENLLRDLRIRYKEAHPLVKKAKKNVKQVEKQIFQHVKLIIVRQEQQYIDFQNKKRRLTKMLSQLEEQNLSFHQKFVAYEDIIADLSLLREQFSYYQKKMKKYDSQRSYQFDILRPIDSAGIPTTPFSPNRTQNYLIGIFLGFISGAVCIFLIEFLDQSIKTVEEIQQITPARIMGFIPFISPKVFLGKTTHAVEEVQNTNVSEAFRAVSTSIFHIEEQLNTKTFVISSALAQDGKTTIFCNLALTLAASNKKVLLIDCDLRRPRLRRLFNLKQGKGFSELLRREVSSKEVIHHINQNLSCITSGKIPANPYETIHNSNIKELIVELEYDYDYILIDAPPIGITTDGFILGQKLSGLLFVVTVHRTPKRMVRQLIQRLHSLEINLQGIILNDVKGSYSSQLSYYNYYGMYYTKSYYAHGVNRNSLTNPGLNPLVEEKKEI
ncbi:GumC family protein [Candidatus Uabimicrobium sp. HlEnr_7]|uniref:GumC family protein n=1 Tax=Candidatus Uabimicrobium helgolandensis TaxID=3095367 RepID=UPI0035591D93